MKLHPDVIYENLSETFQKHLQFIDPTNAKAAVWAIILLLYDPLLLVGLTSIGKMTYLWMTLPMILVLHLWGLRLLFKNAYTTQMEMVLFTGILGWIGAITSSLLIIGLSVHTLSLTSMLYYIIMVLILVISSIFIIKSQLDTYKRDPCEELDKQSSKYKGLLYIGPGLGIVLAGVTRDTNVYIETFTTIGIIFILFLLYVYFAARFIHKYLFMKANVHLVTFQRPSKKKDRIQLSKKGVEIK